MSTPISACAIFKAAFGDKKTEEWLINAMDANVRRGAYTLFPCECKPPCALPSDEQLEALDKRVHEALVARREERAKKQKGSIRPFEKVIFPVIKTAMPPLDTRTISNE